MTAANPLYITLEEFLKYQKLNLPVNILMAKLFKPHTKIRHSRVQGNLIDTINEVVEKQRIGYAFPELRLPLEGAQLSLMWQFLVGNKLSWTRMENL